MDKQTFMQELEHRLRHLTDEDKYDALEYYNEYIDDLNLDPNADVCQFIGTPKEIARQIIDQTVERKIDEQQENNTAKGIGSVIRLWIIGICASPIALPLAIVAIAIIFSLLISMCGVLISFYAAGGSLTVAGLAYMVLGFFSGSIPQIITQLGCGMLVSGLGLLAILGTIKLTRLFISLIRGIVKIGIKRRKNNREENSYE